MSILLGIVAAGFFYGVRDNIHTSLNNLDQQIFALNNINHLMKQTNDLQGDFDAYLSVTTYDQELLRERKANIQYGIASFDESFNDAQTELKDRSENISTNIMGMYHQVRLLSVDLHDFIIENVDLHGSVLKELSERADELAQQGAGVDSIDRSEGDDSIGDDHAHTAMSASMSADIVEGGADRIPTMKHGHDLHSHTAEVINLLNSIAQAELEGTKVSTKNIIEVRQRNFFYGVTLFFICLLLTFVITILLVHYFVSRPLNKITDSVKCFIAGKRDAEIPYGYKNDEIGLLSRTFSGMVNALIADAQTLEDQVKARTQLIDQKNIELESYVKEIEDVSKNLMRRDKDLTQANERLKEADEAKNEFVSVAAHQLRTPLTAIRWTYEMLSHAKGIPEEHAGAIKNGITATNNLISTVNDMLNVARIDEGRMGFNMQTHDFLKLLKGIVTEFEFDAKHKGLRFQQLIPETPISFDFDWEKIDMVVRNLLSNAMKYTEVGGIVRLGIVVKEETIAIIVADNGIGIPQEQKSRIFTKFFRADNALLHQTNGSGLGLYVTRDIVEKHEGTITLESEEEKGTTFTVVLPLKGRK